MSQRVVFDIIRHRHPLLALDKVVEHHSVLLLRLVASHPRQLQFHLEHRHVKLQIPNCLENLLARLLALRVRFAQQLKIHIAIYIYASESLHHM